MVGAVNQNDSIEATFSADVTDRDTAQVWSPELPPAVSTPFVLGVAEMAAHKAMVGSLDPPETTVGVRATIEHIAAAPIGARISARARLVERDGRRLRFEADVHHGATLIASVSHDRVVVDVAKMAERWRQIEPPPAAS